MEPQRDDVHELFLTLFTADEPAIRAFVRRLVPTRLDAADVMQGVALVLWRKFPRARRTATVSQVGIWHSTLRGSGVVAR